MGTKVPMIRKVVIIDVHIWKTERKEVIEYVQLIISTNEDEGKIKCSLCYCPKGKMELEIALYRQIQRYWVERAFQNTKKHLGLHQSQVRSWNGLHHHLTLTMMALHFMMEVQQEAQI